MTTQVTPISQATSIGTLLVSQGEKLSETSEKAINAFKENQEQQKKTIETLTKAYADLEAKFLQKEAELAQLKAADNARQKAFEAELNKRKEGLNIFIETAEKQLGPILKHLRERKTVSEDFRNSVSPCTYERRVYHDNQYNARMEVLTNNGVILETQITQLKKQF